MTNVRGGFTLLEVMVAAVVAATVLLGARVVYETLAAAAHDMTRLERTDTEARTSETALARMVAQVDVSPGSATDSQRTFGGDESHASFASWCIRPGGWEASCEITLRASADTAHRDGIVTAESSAGERGRITTTHPPVLRYLLDARAGGTWLRNWPTGPTAPIAIGVIAGRDTLVLRVGGRG